VLCCWLRAAEPRAWEHRHLLEPIRREGRLPGMATEAEIREWLGRGGLELERVDDFSREVERTWPVCIRRTLVALLRDAGMRRYLLGRHRQSRVFAVTLLRIWLAYALGAVGYRVFTACKPRGSALA